MTTSIFIRSYRGDRFWLDYCLRSLKKFAHGFKEIVVVLPKGDEPHFDGTNFHGARVVWWDDLPGDGYLGQQHCKMYADTIVDSDYVFFVDSDCFAEGEVHPDMYRSGVKPIQLLRYWEGIGDAAIWEPITEKAMGFAPRFEHMAFVPLMYWRNTLTECRKYMEGVHDKTLGQYIQSVPARSFSEFNALGAFAHAFQPHLYDWRLADPATDGVSRIVKQYWSWGGFTEGLEEKFQKFLQ